MASQQQYISNATNLATTTTGSSAKAVSAIDAERVVGGNPKNLQNNTVDDVENASKSNSNLQNQATGNSDKSVSKIEKTLAEWLKDEPDLLKECTEWYTKFPEWWGISPNSTIIFYRSQDEVKEIRKKPGESGGHHPHGLALGGPEGQKLTPTNETAKIKNETHSKVTGLQRKVINKIKKQL